MSDNPSSEHPSGVPDGTVLETREGDDVVRERVVHDADGSWHKEVVT